MFFPFNLMEPKLLFYRLVMAIGCIGLYFSEKAVFFPKGWLCILALIFTVIYLWEELMCADPMKEMNLGLDRGQWFNSDLESLRNNTIVLTNWEKLGIFIFAPIVSWYVLAFGVGYIFHHATANMLTQEYVVTPLASNSPVHSESDTAVRFKNLKTYHISDVHLSASDYKKIDGKIDAVVEIDSYVSVFGKSLDQNFKLKKVK